MARYAHSRVLSMMPTALLLAGLFAPSAVADVQKNEAHGFVSVHEVEIAAPPERVWEALVEEVDEWWDPAHTYSGDAGNMEFVKEFGGHAIWLWEWWDKNHVRHMDVDLSLPPKTLRLRGALGPLQPLAVVGSMTFNLAEATESVSGNGSQKTRLAYRYVVQGPALRDWAEPVDRVMGEQLDRLRRHVETGKPTAPPRDDSR